MTSNNDTINAALRAAGGVRVSLEPEPDEDTAAINLALRRAAGRLPPEDDDTEPVLPPPAALSAEGSGDGGARVPAPAESSDTDLMNALIRRRRVMDAAGTAGFYDPSTGVFTPS